MNGTPRLRSAFPDTPKTEPGAFKSQSLNPTPSRSAPRRSVIRPSPIVNAKPLRPSSAGEPVISLEFLDGPTQRLYVAAFYIALVAWKLFNALNISDDSDIESTWLFLKWTAIDAAFLLALPAFRIPWLEWSFLTTMVIWLLHASTNLFLMYRITIPVSAWLGALVKVAYDRELSLSDHRVNPASILHNSSIILGKQIINLLPEGSAILNPDKKAFCLDSSRTTVELPIRINQTTPESIEILRYDLDTDEVETIVIGAKQARKLKSIADKGHDKHETNTPRTLQYSVSKKGLYQLQKVIDKSKLEVRRRSFDVAVVPCPEASVSAHVIDRCMGDLSGISLHVTGVPPFKVKYSKRINHQFTSVTQNIQPPELDQDLSPEGATNVITDPKRPQMGWTKSTSTSVDINESLHQNGTWSYSIEEIEDGLANKVTFDSEPSTKKVTNSKFTQSITVHKRPQINFVGCDGEHFLRVAKERSTPMPLQIKPKGQLPNSDWPLKLKYTFTAEAENGIPAIEDFQRDLSNQDSVPMISKAGRYDITSVESQFCQGEVNEPSSCLLFNPPRPAMNWESKEVFDKCAGRPIGMTVNLDFTGTPPFKVRYEVSKAGAGVLTKIANFNTMRGQLEFQEQSAGSYKYQMLEIQDAVYDPISIRNSQNTIQQDIRPSADALFKGSGDVGRVCLEQPISFVVRLLGEGPWDLEYELVHAGKRKKFTAHSENEEYTIDIPGQTDGGKYTLILTGIQDASHCRVALNEERTIEVRTEQPRAGFGDIDRRWTIESLEGKAVKLPLKLKGTAPWTVQIQNIEKGLAPTQYVLREANSIIQADAAGTYQIVAVHDSCPGVVDPKADKFQVSWIQHPNLYVKDTTTESKSSNIFQKRPVCQGDEDVLNLALSGHSPYHLKYQVKSELVKGQTGHKNKALSVASGNAVIHMDTARAGHYTYTFNELADDRYDHNKGHFTPVVVRQEVFAPPTAKFSNSGKTYGYCRDEAAPPSEAESENIPIKLTGEPPFALDIAITHHGVSSRPEVVRVKDILTNSYSWSLARSSLGIGTHSLQIRAVKDSRGCETLVDSNPSSVRIHVSQPPAIIPLEATTDYCVGDHLSFSLSGQAPFDIFYNFQNRDRKAHVTSNEFRRISDYAGEFIITGVSDAAMGGGGKCKAKKDIRKHIHPYPTVSISHGKTVTSDIHEGGEVEIVFEFTGTPPFEFTYTRSENVKKGRKAQVLETRHDTSNEFTKIVRASDAGTYEVVAIKDRYCAFSAPGLANPNPVKGQKLLL